MGFAFSNCLQRIRRALEEKGITWESHHVSLPAYEHLTDAYQMIGLAIGLWNGRRYALPLGMACAVFATLNVVLFPADRAGLHASARPPESPAGGSESAPSPR